MLRRHLTDAVLAEAARNPVVVLMGPRQSGKTTLARAAFAEHAYVSLEDPAERREAREDPESFLARYAGGVVIDEVQRVPQLLSYIQVIADEEQVPGRFILTGSQNLLMMQSVSQTLAGRAAIFTLLPFSLTELNERAPCDRNRLTEASRSAAPPVDRWTTVWTGLYPRIHDRGLDPQRWLSDYHRTYVERDVRDILRVMDLDRFERFVRLTAARTGQELNITSLAEDVGITQPTAKQWMTALRISSLITLLPPHHQSYRKRLRKRPKLHFIDTGLACYLLGITSPQILENHPLRGAIFESFVVSELTKAFVHGGREAPLFHWRDATGHEIDVLVDFGDRLLPIEIKSGISVAEDAFDALRWWTGIETNPNESGVLVHGGARSYLHQRFCVRPWWVC